MAWKISGSEVKYLVPREQAATSKNDEKKILAYLGENALEKLMHLSVPKIEGHELIKKALLLSMFSLDDCGGDVQRIHTLLFGDEGTGKGKFLSWVSDSFDVPKLSHRTTEAGLTGNLNVIGSLASNPMIAVDEIDKMKSNDINGLLEAMSEGYVEMSQASGHIKYPAPVRVVCACNQTNKFSRETMDRFDFQIRLRHPEKEQAMQIISKRMRGWGNTQELPIPMFWIKLWIVLSHQPRPVLVNVEKCEGLITSVIDSGKSIRKYESILRIALSWARLEMKDCDETHIQRAIDLLSDIRTTYQEHARREQTELATIEVHKP